MWGQSGPVAVSSGMPAGAAGAPAGAPNTSVALPAAASYSLQAQALAAAAENVPRPAMPGVLMHSDRQVYVENVEVPAAGYTVARRWMRNEPEVDVESIVGPATSAVILPRPLELSTEGVEEPPPLVDDVDDYDPEQAVIDLKRHWVRQRRHATALRMRRVERCRDRLKLVAAANTLAVTQLLAAQQQQQQQGAALQHQQLLQLQQLQHQAKQQRAAAGANSQAQQQQQGGGVVLQLPPHALTAMQQALKQEDQGAAAAVEGNQGQQQQQRLDLTVPAEGADTAAAGDTVSDAVAVEAALQAQAEEQAQTGLAADPQASTAQQEQVAADSWQPGAAAAAAAQAPAVGMDVDA